MKRLLAYLRRRRQRVPCTFCDGKGWVNPGPKLVWRFACKHGLPNFVHCPECDGKETP